MGGLRLARWRLLEPEADVVSELVRTTGMDPLCARVLANRGVTPEGAEGFLAPSLKTIGAPEEEAWGVAARRVARAIEGGERIGIFGDYDTDGITSAAVLYLALSHYTDNLAVQLPIRQVGYGLLEPYVRDLFAEGVDLLITADCGVSNAGVSTGGRGPRPEALGSWRPAGRGGGRVEVRLGRRPRARGCGAQEALG
jgi:single-stranded-DNA-specific exonuclease